MENNEMLSSRHEFAKKLTNLIVNELHPEKVILFGSVAYGQEKMDSDIDLFIIQDTQASFPDRLKPIYKLASRLGYPFALEPIVYTPQEFREAQTHGSAFVAEVLNGKILYEH